MAFSVAAEQFASLVTVEARLGAELPQVGAAVARVAVLARIAELARSGAASRRNAEPAPIGPVLARVGGRRQTAGHAAVRRSAFPA